MADIQEKLAKIKIVKNVYDTLNSNKADRSELGDLSNKVTSLSIFVTPQMFGAKADGITDDTIAIQTALDQGGLIYFPTGRYKVTSQLNALVPSTIKMECAYPSVYSESDYEGYTYPMNDYPIDNTYNHFGARLETSANGIGLLVGESVVIDGLNIRAMEGFTGTVLKYDGSKGTRSYPSNTRLMHIKISNDTKNVTPDVMFDFAPYGNYGVIVDDVIIGSNHVRQYATYGFRCILDKWVNSIRLNNINVEMFSTYPFYINGRVTHNGSILYASNWVLKNICIQAYPAKSYDSAAYIHKNLFYLEGMTGTHISGCKLWDVDAATINDGIVNTIDLLNTTSIGNDTYINNIDQLLTKKIENSSGLNLSSLEISVASNSESGGNDVTMKDSFDNTKTFNIPAIALTDKQIGTAIDSWMSNNATPVEQIGKNKLNPNTCYDGDINPTYGTTYESIYAWVTGKIPCTYGDQVRVFETITAKSSGAKTYRQRTLSAVFEYNAQGGYIGRVTSFSNNIYTPSSNSVASFCVRFDGKNGNYPAQYEDRDKCMVTINNTDSTLETYKIELVGGLGQYLVLSAPNGDKYTLSVDNNGNLSAIKV